MVAHRLEHPGAALQLLLHRDQEHRVRHGPAALGGERGGPEQLGQTVGGEERGADQAGARRKATASGHTDVVRGDDDGDRPQRIARLRQGDVGACRASWAAGP